MFTKSCVHLHKFIVSSAVVALGLIVAMSKWQKIVMRANTKELEDWRKNRNKDREPEMQPLPREVRGEIDV